MKLHTYFTHNYLSALDPIPTPATSSTACHVSISTVALYAPKNYHKLPRQHSLITLSCTKPRLEVLKVAWQQWVASRCPSSA